MSDDQTSTIYRSIINQVIDKAQRHFIATGLDETVLIELKNVWEQKLFAQINNPPASNQQQQQPTNEFANFFNNAAVTTRSGYQQYQQQHQHLQQFYQQQQQQQNSYNPNINQTDGAADPFDINQTQSQLDANLLQIKKIPQLDGEEDSSDASTSSNNSINSDLDDSDSESDDENTEVDNLMLCQYEKILTGVDLMSENKEREMPSFLQRTNSAATASLDKASMLKLLNKKINRKIKYSSTPTPPPKTPLKPVNSPAAATVHTPTQPSEAAQLYLARSNKNTLESSFNSHIPIKPSSGGKVQVCVNSTVPPYKYCYEKLNEIGDGFDERIDWFANKVFDFKELSQSTSTNPIDPNKDNQDQDVEEEEEGWSRPSVPSNQVGYYIGRVLCDSFDDDSKLNLSSVVLETSTSIDSASRVNLNLKEYINQQKPLRIFPGQIIAVKGTNPSGRSILVQEIYYPPPPPMPTSSIQQLLNYGNQPKSGEEQVSGDGITNIIVASGPFTLDDNLLYEPLDDLIKVVSEEKPDILILLGPFVDSHHPLIASGDVDMMPNEIFRTRISDKLRTIKGVQIILIPSIKDATTPFPTFPQPPLAAATVLTVVEKKRMELGLSDDCFMLFSNPVLFQVDEVCFGVCTLDSIMNLGSNEVCINLNNDEPRIQRLYRHILEQRHYYPLYPPPINQQTNLNLGKTYSPEFNLKVSPDILISPSKLKHSVGMLDDRVLVVNPGKLCSGKYGGTFIRMCVYGIEKEKLKGSVVNGYEEDFLGHGVGGRCRIDVVRV